METISPSLSDLASTALVQNTTAVTFKLLRYVREYIWND